MSFVTSEERTPHLLSELLAILQGQGIGQPSLGSAIGTALGIPGAVEFWMMGNYDKSSGLIYGLAQGRNLTNVGTTPFGWSNLVPFADLDGSTQYFSRADEAQLDMLSASGSSGVMLFGWFYVERLATGEMLICKRSGATSNYNYYLFKTSGNFIQANIWNGGVQTAVVSSNEIGIGWHFLGMVWNSSKLSVFVDGVETSTTTSIPATASNSTAAFTIGAEDGGGSPFQGLVSCVFLGHRTAEVFFSSFYHMTRKIYGI